MSVMWCVMKQPRWFWKANTTSAFENMMKRDRLVLMIWSKTKVIVLFFDFNPKYAMHRAVFAHARSKPARDEES